MINMIKQKSEKHENDRTVFWKNSDFLTGDWDFFDKKIEIWSALGPYGLI